MLRMLKDWEKAGNREDYVNVGELAALEAELYELKEKYHLPIKKGRLIRWMDARIAAGKKREIHRRTYIRLALWCGWFCGAHRFYACQYLLGTLYLLLCWTGLPFCMTLINLMIVLPKKADETGNIII